MFLGKKQGSQLQNAYPGKVYLGCSKLERLLISTYLQPCKLFQGEGKFLNLHSNIRLGWKLKHSSLVHLSANYQVKKSIEQALGEKPTKKGFGENGGERKRRKKEKKNFNENV